MKHHGLLGIVSLVLAISISFIHPAAAQNSSDWINLSDETSLDKNWVQRGGAAKYSAENGIIVGETVPDTPNSFLCTKDHFCNFILEYDVLVDPSLNSGVQIRSNSYKDYQDGRVHGYQVEIDPSERAWSGGIYDEGRRGWLFDLENQEEARKAFKNGEWNHFRVEANGNRIKTWVNGVEVSDLQDDMTSCGFIGLQVHSTDSQEPLQVKWRDVRVRVIGQD